MFIILWNYEYDILILRLRKIRIYNLFNRGEYNYNNYIFGKALVLI